jgi:hypothetical protein
MAFVVAAVSWALCVGIAEAFLPMPGCAGLSLRASPSAEIRRSVPLLRKPRASVLRMSSHHDRDDAVLRRVEAIMEVTSLQLVVSYFEHAFVSEPATIPADVLEASLAAPTAENPLDPLSGDGEAAGAQQEANADNYAAMPPSIRPGEQQPPANPVDCPPHDSAPPSAPEPQQPVMSEDVQGVLERAQAMADVMGDDVAPATPVPQSENAADILARVNMMMDMHDDAEYHDAEAAEAEHTRE